jgi:hypothetical protein
MNMTDLMTENRCKENGRVCLKLACARRMQPRPKESWAARNA